MSKARSPGSGLHLLLPGQGGLTWTCGLWIMRAGVSTREGARQGEEAFNPGLPTPAHSRVLCRSCPAPATLRGPVPPTNGQQMINGMITTLGDHAIYLQLHGRGGRI